MAEMQSDRTPLTPAPSLPLPAWLQRARSASISIESAVWLMLLAVTAFTRFWDLGYRQFHHDEGIHVYYSWAWTEGILDYKHNPLSHGPFLFHVNAFIYWLFGESNTTSRLAPALAGVAIVALPWLLRSRSFLGRWGALAAGFILFISPSMLYYTRFIRHDPYTVLFSLTLAIAIFRYLEHPQRRWMITAFISVALLMTNHEIFFAIFLVFIVVLWGSLVLTRLRSLIPVHLAAVALGLIILALHRIQDWKPLPAIPWENANNAETKHFYAQVFENPLVLSLLILAVMFVVGCIMVGVWQAQDARPEDDPDAATSEVLFGDAPSPSIARGVLAAWRDGFGLALGTLIAFFIWLALYTSLFTNPEGVETATYSPRGTLLYWLGQQDVQRGNQPWFYFITEGLQYEWLALVLGMAGAVFALVRLVNTARGAQFERSTLFLVFCASWMAFMFLVLSWAGEKMPWLIVHIVLPAALIGAVLIDEVVEAAVAAWHNRRPGLVSWTPSWTVAVTGGLVTLSFAAFFVLARLTVGHWTDASGVWERVIPQSARNDWWLLAVAPLVALAIVCGAMVLGGLQRAAHATLAAALVVMVLFQINAGYRVTFLDGDGAKDTLIYNTVGTDVMQMRHDVEELSRRTYGNLSMPVVWDGCLNTPLNVDLNAMPNARWETDIATIANEAPPVILTGPERDADCSLPAELTGYTAQTYMFRWHENEAEVYRNFAIAPEIPVGTSAWKLESDPHGPGAIIESIWNSCKTLATPEGQQEAFRLELYHEADTQVLTYYFQVLVRDDYLPVYNEIRYGN